MTNELEKQFFEVFGIANKEVRSKDCERCDYYEEAYDAPCYVCTASKCPYVIRKQPQITDRILLELILINMHNEDLFGYPTNIQKLKDNTLKQLIETYNNFSTCVTCDGEYQQSAREIKHQVRTLFEEG